MSATVCNNKIPVCGIHIDVAETSETGGVDSNACRFRPSSHNRARGVEDCCLVAAYPQPTAGVQWQCVGHNRPDDPIGTKSSDFVVVPIQNICRSLR